MSKEEKRIYMQSMISDWRESGKSKKQYCVEKDISLSTFYYWFSRHKAIMDFGKGFVEINRAEHGGERQKLFTLMEFG